MKWIFLIVMSLATLPAGASLKAAVCADKKECPSWFAHLKTSTGGNCSSFLLRPDVMATNRHCVPDDITRTKDSCRGKISFHFPENDRDPAEVAECAEVLDISDKFGDEYIPLDIAILKLDKPLTREPAELVQSGIADNAKLTIYKMDPTEAGGIVRKVECLAVQKSIINPYFNTDLSPVVFFRNCPIIKGNSGSPILTGKNQVAGIVSNLSLILTPDSVREDVGTKVAGNGGHGTNFSCLNTFFLGYNKGFDPACRIPLDDKYAEELKKKLFDDVTVKPWKEAQEAFMARLKKAAEEILMPIDPKTLIRRDQVEKDSEKITQSYELSPACVRWASIMNDGGKTLKASLKLRAPEVETDVDEHYRFITKTIERPLQIDFQWNFHQAKNNRQKILLNWVETGRYAKRKQFILPHCPFTEERRVVTE